MEHEPKRLVERIFSGQEEGAVPRFIPSLFQQVKPPPGPLGVKPRSRPRFSVTKRYPIGLDIGLTSLKWVQLGVAERRTQIVELGSEPIRSASEKPRAAEWQNALRDASARHGLKGRAVLSLPLEEVSLRLLKISALPEREMEQTIRWQIEQALPAGMSYDEFTVDYLPLRDMGEESGVHAHVLVVCAPRRRVMEMMEIARGAGFQPVAVEIDPFAFADGLISSKKISSQETVLLLHLGDSASTFSIVMKGQWALGRSLLMTGRSLTQAVSDHLRVSADEARRLLQTQGLTKGNEGDAAAVARALASPLENLLVNILHTFSSFSHRAGQSAVRFDRVFLGGGVSQLPGFGLWLQSQLNVPVESADPLSWFPMEKSIAGARPPNGQSASFAIAMGLAMREVDSA